MHLNLFFFFLVFVVIYLFMLCFIFKSDIYYCLFLFYSFFIFIFSFVFVSLLYSILDFFYCFSAASLNQNYSPQHCHSICVCICDNFLSCFHISFIYQDQCESIFWSSLFICLVVFVSFIIDRLNKKNKKKIVSNKKNFRFLLALNFKPFNALFMF